MVRFKKKRKEKKIKQTGKENQTMSGPGCGCGCVVHTVCTATVAFPADGVQLVQTLQAVALDQMHNASKFGRVNTF